MGKLDNKFEEKMVTSTSTTSVTIDSPEFVVEAKHSKVNDGEHDIEKVIEKNNEKKAKKEERDKKIKEQNEAEKRNKKKKKLANTFLIVYRNLIKIFVPDTYVALIQRFENLLFVIFVDCLMLFTLMALLYILYIVIIGYNGDWIEMLFKIGSCVIVAVICLFAQSNIPSPSNNKNQHQDNSSED